VKYAAGRLYLLFPLGLLLAIVGGLLFWPPYRLTGVLVARLRLPRDVRATWQLLGGAVLYAAWLTVLVWFVWRMFGWVTGVSAIVLIPAVAVAGLYVRENWRSTLHDIRRFMLLRTRRPLIEKLREEQKSLAERLDQLR
jgi:hypothetical protein